MEITVQMVYEAMARLAPPQLAENWDNVGLLVDCGRPVTRALTTLDITPEVVEEAARLGCEVIVSHHPVIFSPLKKLSSRDVPFLLVQAGISAICMHTNYDAAEGGVNEILAELFAMRDPEPFANGCGRVGEIDPISVPQLAALAQDRLGCFCVPPLEGQAVQVKYTDNGRPVRRLAVISGAGGSMFEDALAVIRRSGLPRRLRRQTAGPGTDRGGTLRHRIPGRRCPGGPPPGGSTRSGGGGQPGKS